jgi:hypothetical protein
MGRDKVENEVLIRWGWEEDVWFHVDNLSSAHVYLRLREGMTWDTMPKEFIEDCSQLTKANSIQGCKESSVKIVYTPWSNLKKTGDMATGQVGFHKQSLVKYVTIEKKNEIVNRLNKTKKEEDSHDWQHRREAHDAELTRKKKKEQKERLAKEEKERYELEQQRKAEKELKNYSSLMVTSNMTSNVDNPPDEDDFM